MSGHSVWMTSIRTETCYESSNPSRFDSQHAMTPSQFLQTLYLGDRACMGLVIDCWNARVEMVVDRISRIRSVSEGWNFDATGDIEKGRLVFEKVTSLSLSPAGPLPNDVILGIHAEPEGDGHRFTIKIASVNDQGNSTEVTVDIVASGLFLVDPSCPQVEIRS